MTNRTSLVNETILSKLSKTTTHWEPCRDSSSFENSLNIIDSLPVPPINLSNPLKTIQILLTEWQSIKNLLRLCHLDRMQLAKENSILLSKLSSFKSEETSQTFMKIISAIQSKKIEKTPVPGGFYNENDDPITARESQLSFFEDSDTELACLREVNYQCSPIPLGYSGFTEGPRHRPRSSNFGSIVLEEGRLNHVIMPSIVRNKITIKDV